MTNRKMTFNEFCQKKCDDMYNPKLSQDEQCTGYYQLKKMVQENITPATLEETERWRTNPTIEELVSISDIKHLQFLHVNLRPYIIDNWDYIKTLN